MKYKCIIKGEIRKTHETKEEMITGLYAYPLKTLSFGISRLNFTDRSYFSNPYPIFKELLHLIHHGISNSSKTLQEYIYDGRRK